MTANRLLPWFGSSEDGRVARHSRVMGVEWITLSLLEAPGVPRFRRGALLDSSGCCRWFVPSYQLDGGEHAEACSSAFLCPPGLRGTYVPVLRDGIA